MSAVGLGDIIKTECWLTHGEHGSKSIIIGIVTNNGFSPPGTFGGLPLVVNIKTGKLHGLIIDDIICHPRTMLTEKI